MKHTLALPFLLIGLAACESNVTDQPPSFQAVSSPVDGVPPSVTLGRVPEGYLPARKVVVRRIEITRALWTGLSKPGANSRALYQEATASADSLGDPVASSSVRQSSAQIILRHFGSGLSLEETEQHVRLLVEAGSPNARVIADGLERLRGRLSPEETRALARTAQSSARHYLQRRCPECLRGGNASSDTNTPEGIARDAQLGLVTSGLAHLARLAE